MTAAAAAPRFDLIEDAEPQPERRARASWRPTPTPMQTTRLAAEASLAADAMLRAAVFLERQGGFDFQGDLNPRVRATELRSRRDTLLAAALAVRS